MDLFGDVLQTLPHPNLEIFMTNTIPVKNGIIYMELVTEINK